MAINLDLANKINEGLKLTQKNLIEEKIRSKGRLVYMVDGKIVTIEGEEELRKLL